MIKGFDHVGSDHKCNVCACAFTDDEGSFQLTINGHTRNLVPGSTFHIPAGVEHSEVYGPEGATWWVGRS